MADLPVTLVTGLALGVTYGLLGAAVSLVWVATRSLFLAAGPVLVAGVLVRLFLGIDVLLDLPAVVPVAAGVVVAAGLSALLEPLVVRPFRDDLIRLIGLAVAGVVLEAAVVRTLGTRTYRPQPLVDLAPVVLGDVRVPGATVLALVAGVPLVAFLVWVTARTRLGGAARLVGGSPPAAQLLGVSPRRTHLAVLALAGAAIAVAGLLVAPVATVGVTQGASFTLRAVAAAALFGVVGPGRALAGGMVLGLVEAAAQHAAPALPGDVAVGAVVVGVLVLVGDPSRRGWGRAW